MTGSHPGTAENPTVSQPGFVPILDCYVSLPNFKVSMRRQGENSLTICNIIQHRWICVKRRIEESKRRFTSPKTLVVDTIDDRGKNRRASRRPPAQSVVSAIVHLSIVASVYSGYIFQRHGTKTTEKLHTTMLSPLAATSGTPRPIRL